MPVPQFDANGVLPPFQIFDATLDEIQERFGTENPQRQELFTRLSRYYARLSRLGNAQELFIDGSFVTAKPFPTDIDILVVYREGYDLALPVTQEERDLIDYSEVRRVFNFDLFSLNAGSMVIPVMLDIYHRGRATGPQKGILRLRP